jgi:hypothetical protein
MIKRMSATIILLLTYLFSGCATYKLPLYNGAVQTKQIFNRSYDEVYDGVTKAAFEMNLNTVVIDKSSGLQRFESAGINSIDIQRYTNARRQWGKELLRDLGSKVDINILVSKQDEVSANVAIRCNFDVAYALIDGSLKGFQVVYEPSATTGFLETKMFLEIAGLIGDSEAMKNLSSKMDTYNQEWRKK